jgi:hypothetical protein
VLEFFKIKTVRRKNKNQPTKQNQKTQLCSSGIYFGPDPLPFNLADLGDCPGFLVSSCCCSIYILSRKLFFGYVILFFWTGEVLFFV